MRGTTLMPGRARPRDVVEAWSRFMYLYGIVLVALPVLAVFVFAGPIYWWWIERFESPKLESELGFRLEHRQITLPADEPRSVMMIVTVDPGGAFDRAGVKVGDTVTCLHHGRGDFWGALLQARDGYEAEFKVVSQERVAEGCSAAHRVTLQGRPIRGSGSPQNNWMQLTGSARCEVGSRRPRS